MTFLTALGVLGACGATFGGYVLGAQMPGIDPQYALLIGDGIALGLLFAWMIGFMVELQQSEMLNLERLLGLPVSIRQVFVLNYLASLVTPTLIILVPFLLGVSVGWGLRQPLQGAVFLALGGSLVLIVTSVAYLVRGWLAVLFANKRRRRAIVVGLGLFAMVAGQAPNLILNNPYMRERRQQERRARREMMAAGKPVPRESEIVSPAIRFWHKAVPPLWIGYGTLALREGRVMPAAAIALAVLAGSGWVLRRSYRITLQAYLAAPRPAKVSRAPPTVATQAGAPRAAWVEKSIPLCSVEVSSMTVAFMRALWQAPEIKMALLSPLIIVIMMVTMQFNAGNFLAGGSHEAWKVTGTVVVSMLSLAGLCSNTFGLDRNGFRSLVLCPVDRRRILLAKNLACMPLGLAMGIVVLIIARFLFGLSWAAWLAGFVQLLAACLLMTAIGNVTSILLPFRVQHGTLRSSKVDTGTMLFRYFFHIASLFLLGVLFIPAGLEGVFKLMGMGHVPVYLIASVVLAVMIGAGYWLSLPALGELLHRREQQILHAVTHEVE